MIYAVIPTGNRPKEYKSVYDWCIKRNICTITIATSENSLGYVEGHTIISADLNISKWWNLGLKEAYDNKADVVLVLNDDVALTDNWLERVLVALQGKSGASGARHRTMIQGYAFALNGKDEIYADEDLVWYFTDDAVQRACENKNGFGLAQGLNVFNKYARSSESFMREQIERDRKKYEEKYGN